ncbi:glycosyltransferase family protein [Pararhodonellum marinum]|uniref:glycosyltransferase family protein n=1 Tax=Pararhodonellum marinum TaxID=2755358 RepID=UPI001890A5F2|nr:glycosyltransferase family protein [Pararhodonellum marinum]
MKFLFIVQGEGRGHMTQAISMFQRLSNQGHEVLAVVLGKSQRRQIPEFVHREIQCPIYLMESPNFVADQNQKSIQIRKTIFHNLRQMRKFKKSLDHIHRLVLHHEPDIILNFYDLLGGIYNALYRPKAKFWVIGHQYLIKHPDFIFASGRPVQKILFILNTHLSALGASKWLALSFRPMATTKDKKLLVLPPLLRKQVKQLCPSEGDFYLSYAVNAGYGEEILKYASLYPDLKVEAFWDHPDHKLSYSPIPNLTFHPIDDVLFLQKMATCKGLVTTAGFESICEALYLGKQAMMIPVKGQYEQACNALDAEVSGAGISNDSFDFCFFESFLNENRTIDNVFKDWEGQFELLLGTAIQKEIQETGVLQKSVSFS